MPQTGARLETGRRRTSRNGAVAFTIIVFAAACALVLACAQLLAGGIGLAALVIAVVVGALAASSVHIVMEWERAVVMRFGRFNRVAGPGIVFTWPVIEFYTVRIDQRVAATYFGAEETLTSDLVPVNVDAVVFWMVFSPKKAAVEVEDYASAVAWMAQATLRAAIGRASLAEAEADISDMLKDASASYAGDPEAMRLRTMHLAYESVKQSGGTLVIPSAFSEGFVPEGGEKA